MNALINQNVLMAQGNFLFIIYSTFYVMCMIAIVENNVLFEKSLCKYQQTKPGCHRYHGCAFICLDWIICSNIVTIYKPYTLPYKHLCKGITTTCNTCTNYWANNQTKPNMYSHYYNRVKNYEQDILKLFWASLYKYDNED